MRTQAKKIADDKSAKKIYANLKVRKEILTKLREYAARNGLDQQAALLKLLE